MSFIRMNGDDPDLEVSGTSECVDSAHSSADYLIVLQLINSLNPYESCSEKYINPGSGGTSSVGVSLTSKRINQRNKV